MTVSYPVGATGQFLPPMQFVDDDGLPLSASALGDLLGSTITSVNYRGKSGIVNGIDIISQISATAPWEHGGFVILGNPAASGQPSGMVSLCPPDEMFEAADSIKVWYEGDGVHLIADTIEVKVDCPTAEEISAALAGLEAVTTGPIVEDGDQLTITSGDDYTASATPSTAINIVLTGDGYGSLTGDTWKLWLMVKGTAPIEAAVVATSGGAYTLNLACTLTAAQTGTLPPTSAAKPGLWMVRQTTQSGGYQGVKKSGKLVVRQDPDETWV